MYKTLKPLGDKSVSELSLLFKLALTISIIAHAACFIYFMRSHNIKQRNSSSQLSSKINITLLKTAKAATKKTIQKEEKKVVKKKKVAKLKKTVISKKTTKPKKREQTTTYVEKNISIPTQELKEEKLEETTMEHPLQEEVHFVPNTHSSSIASTSTPNALIPSASSIQKEQENIANTRSSYLAKIVALIGREKEYPEKARRMRIEGVTKLYIKIAPDGALLDTSLSERTNSSDLNRETLRMAHAAAPFPKPPTEILKGSALSFTVPIRFQLK